MTDATPPVPSPTSAKPRKIKPPRGTRDLYPAEAARRRWLMERWREVSIRHGFEEVDGPTYENADLYAVKSGEGILGELFQAFSGKSPEEVERVKRDGRAPYALRPEFTPTLARMYAAKANTLPKPSKWFMAGPFFRAERPQRGRLREFLQWNVDVLGLDVPQEKWYAEDAESRAEVAEAKARMDGEVIGVLIGFLELLGFTPDDVQIKFNSRHIVDNRMNQVGVAPERRNEVLALLDSVPKADEKTILNRAAELGLTKEKLQRLLETPAVSGNVMVGSVDVFDCIDELLDNIPIENAADWLLYHPAIVRGLAYYTGTVFEVIADGERAVAGGGRYDNLIELFGGPPTPAVGFAMGDVVLSLLLQDKGLMPSDDELLGLVGQHPDVFVLAEENNEEAEAKVRPVVAMLRRGPGGREAHPTDAVGGLHVRHSYKATKKVDKLLAEAKKQHARFAVIIEGAESCVVKDLRTGTQWPAPLALDALHAKLMAELDHSKSCAPRPS